MIFTGIAAWIFGPQIIGFVFLVLGALQYYFPPKKINNWYGYRTPTAKRNQQTWDEGNRFSSRLMMRFGFIVMVIGLLIAAVLNNLGLTEKMWNAITLVL